MMSVGAESGTGSLGRALQNHASRQAYFAAELEEYVEQALQHALEDKAASGDSDAATLFRENCELHARLDGDQEHCQDRSPGLESHISTLKAELAVRTEEIRKAQCDQESMCEKLLSQAHALHEEAERAHVADDVARLARDLREQIESMRPSGNEAAQHLDANGTSRDLEQVRRSAEDASQQFARLKEELSERQVSYEEGMRKEADKIRMIESREHAVRSEAESLRSYANSFTVRMEAENASGQSTGPGVGAQIDSSLSKEEILDELAALREEADMFRNAEIAAKDLREEVFFLRSEADVSPGSPSTKDVAPTVVLGTSWKQVGIVAEVTAAQGVASIGVGFKSMPPNPLIIKKVHPGSWADEVGIQNGDAFLELNSQLISNMTEDDFKTIMQARPLTIKVWRLSNRPHHRAHGNAHRLKSKS